MTGLLNITDKKLKNTLNNNKKHRLTAVPLVLLICELIEQRSVFRNKREQLYLGGKPKFCSFGEREDVLRQCESYLPLFGDSSNTNFSNKTDNNNYEKNSNDNHHSLYRTCVRTVI